MAKYFAFCLLLAGLTGAFGGGAKAEFPDPPAVPLVWVGLTGDDASPSPPVAATTVADDTAPAPVDPPPRAAATANPPNACERVAFSRSLKYGESDLNVLDVATADSSQTSGDAPRRPVLLFVAGESFAGESGAPDAAAALQDEAMCFAARNGMVGVKMAYRLAPANPWPAATLDVAAASSWVHQNIDLFGGNPEEIVAIGYSAGAFHVATFLAHPELQAQDSGVAGAVLVSGLYRISADASAAEKSYFGTDPSKYDERSAFPGILNIGTPLLLAWSMLDPPHLIAQGEKLKQMMCNSPAHCPHTSVLKERADLASVFGPDAPGGGLAHPTLELVREIEARGLP